MERRDFLTVAGGTVAMSLSAAAAETKPGIIEITRIQLRNTTDSMVQRTTEFFGKSYFPALQRIGAAPAGAFNSLIAPDTPFLLLVLQFPTVSAWEASKEKLAADGEYRKARDQWFSGPLQFVRSETSLLRGFRTIPAMEVPALLSGGKSRIFELRTYASNTPGTLERKVRMFDEGEIGLFRKVGMIPVFFGETIAGGNMPNLTYMVGFDDLAARERIWTAFATSPEWEKMRAQPGLSDGEVVSNISNVIVRPTAFSAIR